MRQNNAGQGEASRDTTTTNALKDLYPSNRGGRTAAKPSQTSSSDRPPYKPSAAYKSKKALPKKTLKKATNKPPVLKDIILLPSPHIDEVPRGTFRESLYTRNFAASVSTSPVMINTSDQYDRGLSIIFAKQVLFGDKYHLLKHVLISRVSMFS